jgi:hypothetical protein
MKGEKMLKKLLAVAVVALTVLVLSGQVKAQTLYFCEGVDNDGYPITESTVFNISSGGSYFYFLVRLPYAIDCRSVRYEIYKVDRYGNESYDNTIYQDTERDWTWFWKKVTFYDSGKYNVYVYDCYDYLLTSGSVRTQFR